MTKSWLKETFDFTTGHSASIKFAVKTEVIFEVVSCFPWFFLGYITLRRFEPPEAHRFVIWRLEEGDQVCFDDPKLVGFSKSVRLKTLSPCACPRLR